MMKISTIENLAIGLFLLSFFYKPSHAVNSGAYAVQVPGARAMGRANSVVASVDDASAVTFNPARLTTINGTDVSLGFTAHETRANYTSDLGEKSSTDNGTPVTPNFHVGSNLGTEKWAVGLGVNNPHGLVTKWSTTGPLRYIATKSEMTVWNINPAAAYKINDIFSVGLGIDYYNVSNVEMSKQVNVALFNFLNGFPDAAPDGSQKMSGDGDGFGYDIGVSAVLKEKHMLGLTYRKGANVKVKGDVEIHNMSGFMAGIMGTDYTTGAESTIVIPDQLLLGYAYQATEKWVMEADGEWGRWSKFKEQNVTFNETDPNRLGVLNSGNPTPKDWKNSWSFGVGTEYKMYDRLALRAGYAYANTPVPEKTFEAGTPDSRFNMYTFGAGTSFKDLTLDFAVQLFRLASRTVHNDVGNPDFGNGIYKSTGEFYAFNIGYKFGKKG